MVPTLNLQVFPLMISVASSFMLGFFWYGPFFGSTWASLVKMDISKPPSAEEMSTGMSLSFLNAILSSSVLSVLVQIWRPSVWGVGPDYESKVFYGTVTAFVIWLGFYLPVGLNTLAWERKPWKLFVLNTGYHLTNLVLMAVILSVQL